MARKSARDLLDELEKQFHHVQDKMNKVTRGYLSDHQKEYKKARDTYRNQKGKLANATKKVSSDVERFRKSGTRVAQNQIKKARAVATVLGEALGEAREIMNTAQSKLNSAKPFDKKLKARARALAAFERDWEKKQKDAGKARQDRTKKRKVATKKKD